MSRMRMSPYVLSLAAAVAGMTLASVAGASTVPDIDRDRILNVAEMMPIGQIDERFISYNVESVEVTGGNFWAPYPQPGKAVEAYVCRSGRVGLQ